MTDMFSKLVALLILLFAAFFVPILNVAIEADKTSQSTVDTAVNEFVNNARTSGKITAKEYEKMARKINAVQNGCDIQITYSKLCTMSDGNGGVYTYYDDHNIMEILDIIWNGENITMEKGDKINVMVQNSSPSYGMSLLSAILPKARNVKSIATTYGGYIGNDVY